MITAKQARAKVKSKGLREDYLREIESEILRAVSKNLLHCDWYSYYGKNLSNEEVDEIAVLVEELKRNGYKVRLSVFEPDNRFSNRRAKIHINWE